VLTAILLSFLAGMASYHVLEKHFLALKRLVH
jgi:peptidoglycan/LPS O-acetylase OafA/YrhL